MTLREQLSQLPGFLQDIIFVVVVVGGISLLSQITLGLWTPMVAVESGSMVPNLNIGDIVLIQGSSRTQIITWDEGEGTGYRAFDKSGDVILYRPYGKEKLGMVDMLYHVILGQPYPPDKATPIIHRAMAFVEKGEPMWVGGPLAPFAGYITKGDHNEVIDQQAGEIIHIGGQAYVAGISYLTPVRPEWVIGVARFKIPLVGYVRLLPGMVLDRLKSIL